MVKIIFYEFLERFRKNKLLHIILIASITALAFYPSLLNNFTNWDDPYYLLENNLIKNLSLKNSHQIFKIGTFDTYIPLTFLSYAVEFKLAHFNPMVYHTTNFILHLINVILVFIILSRIGNASRVAFITTILFAISPLRVESVAWISGRKDLLYSFFFLSGMISYIFSIEKPFKCTWCLILSWICFIMSCLSKSQGIVFPAIILLLNIHKINKISKQDILNIFSFSATAIFFIWLAARSVSSYMGSLCTAGIFSIVDKLFLTGYAYIIYIAKIFFPFKLSPIYPFPYNITGYFPLYVYFLCLFALFLLIFFIRLKNFYPYKFSFIWFTINISLPLLTIWSNGYMLNDHYTYLASIGLYLASASFIEEQIKRNSQRIKEWINVFVFLIILIFTSLTFNYCFIWRNSDMLWTHTIANYQNIPIAYQNRADYYRSINLPQKELNDINEFILLLPERIDGYLWRARWYKRFGIFDKAKEDYEKALKLDPANINIKKEMDIHSF